QVEARALLPQRLQRQARAARRGRATPREQRAGRLSRHQRLCRRRLRLGAARAGRGARRGAALADAEPLINISRARSRRKSTFRAIPPSGAGHPSARHRIMCRGHRGRLGLARARWGTLRLCRAVYQALCTRHWMEVIVWFHWVPLFVMVTLIVMRVLWNLDDRPGAAGAAALSATRAGNTVNRLRSAARVA